MSEDLINNPSHYQPRAGGIDCIGAMEAMVGSDVFAGHLRCQVLKYLWRYELKGSPAQDLKKARFYLDRLISLADDAEKTSQQESDELEKLRVMQQLHATDQ